MISKKNKISFTLYTICIALLCFYIFSSICSGYGAVIFLLVPSFPVLMFWFFWMFSTYIFKTPLADKSENVSRNLFVVLFSLLGTIVLLVLLFQIPNILTNIGCTRLSM